MVFWLEKDPPMFPDPALGEPDGLVAVGGSLTPQWLKVAYSNGFFPWYAYKQTKDIEWFCPMERFVIFPDEIHVSHSMRTLINSGRYLVTLDTDFDGVVNGCMTVDKRHDHINAWLGPHILEAYSALHNEQWAHSVEVWNSSTGALAGGLYGVAAGHCFCGESMFSNEPNTSKLALIALALKAEAFGLKIIDCQFHTPHLKSMGGRTIPYDEYMRLLTGDDLKR